MLYISKTDAWAFDEPPEKRFTGSHDFSGRLLKLGLVRVKLDPNPFQDKKAFVQTLNPDNGSVQIKAGKHGQAITVRIWVDAHHPVIRLEINGSISYTMQASSENWRKEDRWLQTGGNTIGWYHQNKRSPWKKTMDQQGLREWRINHQLQDPVVDRTFGCLMAG